MSDEDPADLLKQFRQSPRGGVTRDGPVTLEEMTRRRDGWRQRCEGALGVIRTLKRDRDALAEQLRATEVGHASCDATIGRLHRELAASRAEARRFAEECGRLRDRLAEAEGWPES